MIESKHLSFRVSYELKKKLGEVANSRGLDDSELARQILEDYFADTTALREEVEETETKLAKLKQLLKKKEDHEKKEERARLEEEDKRLRETFEKRWKGEAARITHELAAIRKEDRFVSMANLLNKLDEDIAGLVRKEVLQNIEGLP